MQYDAVLNEGFLGDVGGKGSIFFNFDILCKGFLKNTLRHSANFVHPFDHLKTWTVRGKPSGNLLQFAIENGQSK